MTESTELKEASSTLLLTLLREEYSLIEELQGLAEAERDYCQSAQFDELRTVVAQRTEVMNTLESKHHEILLAGQSKLPVEQPAPPAIEEVAQHLQWAIATIQSIDKESHSILQGMMSQRLTQAHGLSQGSRLLRSYKENVPAIAYDQLG